MPYSQPYLQYHPAFAHRISQMIQSQQSRARRHLFLAERAAFRVPRTTGTPPKVQSVGVIGAGTMGAGIAIAFLFAGFSVTLVDAKQVNWRAGLCVRRCFCWQVFRCFRRRFRRRFCGNFRRCFSYMFSQGVFVRSFRRVFGRFLSGFFFLCSALENFHLERCGFQEGHGQWLKL